MCVAADLLWKAFHNRAIAPHPKPTLTARRERAAASHNVRRSGRDARRRLTAALQFLRSLRACTRLTMASTVPCAGSMLSFLRDLGGRERAGVVAWSTAPPATGLAEGTIHTP